MRLTHPVRPRSIAGWLVVTGLLVLYALEGISLAREDLTMRPLLAAAAEGTVLEPAERRAALERATRIRPDRAEGWLRLGAASSGDASRVAFARAARALPVSARGQCLYGLSRLDADGGGEVRGHLRHAAALAGNSPALTEHIAEQFLHAWRRDGDPQALVDAVECFRRAAERDPRRAADVIQALAPYLADTPALARAIPWTPGPRVALAHHLTSEGLDEAVLDVLSGLEPSGEVERLRARALLRTGRREDGLAAFARWVLLADDPDRAAAAVERELGALPAAERAAFYEQLETVGPRARLARARALLDAGDSALGMAVIDDVLAGYRALPASARVTVDIDIRIVCHDLRRRDREASSLWLQAAVEAEAVARLQPSTERWRRAGRLRARGGDSEGLRSDFERALRVVPRTREDMATEIEEELVLLLQRLGERTR